MLAILLQFSGSLLSFISFLRKNKFDFGNQTKSLIKIKPILRKDAYEILLEKWAMYVGITEIVLGYAFALFKINLFEDHLSNNTIFYLPIVLIISFSIALIITECKIKGFLKFVNSSDSLQLGNGETFMGDLSGINCEPELLKISELEEKNKLLQEEIKRLKNN
ncbi:hypothetical protein [Pedobacter gandavensis]|uniref:Uncharacterized protein n=1 Tax=Pedobacter gandavensis TaxID=2679963 RepID=A0ABR6EXN1_9SPHI|nr:hypothetical protein [Pedobacter gandavensis]MBB2149188.1 hypothetical protein [Pedobacter gandavensis]